MRIFKYRTCLVTLISLVLAVLGCGSDPSTDPTDVAIQVNDVTISIEDFNEQIKLQAYSDPEMNLTLETRRQFINYLIRKELMIQEAIRLKMEREKAFVKTIETYWESTLIRSLLDRKTAEFRKKVLVTEDEIAVYYERHKDGFDQPYDTVKKHIREILESKKIEAAMESWTKQLRADAKVVVNPSMSPEKQ